MRDQAEQKEVHNPNKTKQSHNSRGETTEESSNIPWLEWMVAVLGMVLVVGSISFLIYQALSEAPIPPDIVVEADTITPLSAGYLVKFRALNQGESTAKGVMIEGQLQNTGQTVETSETTLDYIPSSSEIRGGLFFTKDPHQFDLQLRATGYEQP